MPEPHPSRPPAARRRRALLASVTPVALALALAACGSSGSPQAPAGADAALQFSRCMREHGVKNFPDPQVARGGGVRQAFKAKIGQPGAPSPQQMEAAQQACRHFRASLEPKLTPQERVAREEAVLKFTRCMRSHGVNLHATTAGGGVQIRIGRGQGGSGPNPESPAFQAAQKACQGLLPQKGGPGASTQKAGGPGGALGLGG